MRKAHAYRPPGARRRRSFRAEAGTGGYAAAGAGGAGEDEIAGVGPGDGRGAALVGAGRRMVEGVDYRIVVLREVALSWVLLLFAGLLEIVWAIALKLSHGFTRLVPTIIFIIFTIASVALLNLAAKSLPIGTAYAVWTGIGAAGTALIGIVFLGDPVSTVRVLSIVLIIAGVVGLNLAGGTAR